ncbi:MAG: cell division protein FtsA [Alphaproteobacteria bacterium]|nr:cell division protein FtsA [Alphaproteobacteria bacterium]
MKSLTQWLFSKPSSVQGDVIAVLDIGSSKIACFIARADENGLPRVIGIGHQLAEGVRGGLVADMEAVRRAVTAAVATAEQMAGETIERVIVNVAGPLLLSKTVGVELPAGGREITSTDFDRLLAQGQTMAPGDAQGNMQELIHTIPVSHTLDGQKGIRDPLGMTGNILQSQIHLVSAAFGPVRTLITTVARCHLEVERLVAAPYASGLACLVEDEMDLGSTIIDIGAGTTSIGIFFDGNMVFADGIAVGGAHITNDIARGMTTSLNNAERLKTLYGSSISVAMDDREIIDVPQVGEEAPEHANHVPKSHLIRIIQPRLEEIFELVRRRLENSGLNDMAGRRVVLTGGTSQLPGIRDVAQRVLDKQVRLGRPLRITRPARDASADTYGPRAGSQGDSISTGLAESTSGPAFATTAGLLAIAMQPELAAAPGFADAGGGGMFGRLGQWVRQNL